MVIRTMGTVILITAMAIMVGSIAGITPTTILTMAMGALREDGGLDIMAVVDGDAAEILMVGSMAGSAVLGGSAEADANAWEGVMRILLTGLLFVISGCTNVPSGPSALVLPGDPKNESQFRLDEKACRKFAHEQLLATPYPPNSHGEAQLHFDIHYLQCMYSKGHLIPVSGEVIPDPVPPPPVEGAPAAPKKN